MFRDRSLLGLLALLIFASLACNAFAGGGEPTLPPPPPLSVTASPETNSETVGSGGAVATATLPGENTPTGQARVTMLIDLNVRNGPGVQYDRVGFLLKDQGARIIGRAATNGWWKIDCPNDTESLECWVSGGSQYTRAENAAGVPVAEIPPTPTSIPPSLEPGQGLLAYVVNGRLQVLTLDLSQSPPIAGEPTTLIESGVAQVLIAPDGRKIAYTTAIDNAGNNSLNAINLDGSGRQLLVSSDELPRSEEETAVISVVQWLDDSQSLAFNTDRVASSGRPIGSRQDLWLASLDGTVTEQLSAGSGGGTFVIAANNQVILSQDTQIIRTDLGSQSVTREITFDFVNTASEYIYYPQPQWLGGTSQAYVAIPNAEPFGSEAVATLWQIPATGSAQRLGELGGNILIAPVTWSLNGNVLAFVRFSQSGNNLVIANGAGQNATDYDSGTNLSFLGWRNNERDFLYAGEGFWAIGQIGTASVRSDLPAGATVSDGSWISDSAFLLLLNTTSGQQFYMGTPTGQTDLLVDLQTSSAVTFDVWAP